MSNTTHTTLSSLIEMLKEKKLSPVELVTSYLSQIQEKNDLGAFLSTDEEGALQAAREAEKAGTPDDTHPLRGVPLAIKDIFTLNKGSTTCGSRFLEGYHSPFTATCVQKLFDAGALSVGKTNLDEFAMGSSNENSAYGIVKNPWDVKRVPGGSSGGSAAAVAGGLAPAALGTDTGGSIRQPASFCGISGLKPTYGRISRYGMVAFGSSLDQGGPMAVSAKDCALLARVMSGKDPRDSTSVDKPVTRWEEPLEKICDGLRIGVPREYFLDGMNAEVLEKVNNAIAVLEKLGAQRVDLSLPHTDYALAVYYVIAPAEASSNLARFDGVRYGKRASDAHTLQELYHHSRTQGFGSEVKRRIMIGTYVLSSGYYDAYYLKAQKVRRLLQADFTEAFQHSCDIIACPTTPSTAYGIGEKTDDPLEMYLGDIFTVPSSLAGLPAMSIPCGFDSQNLPIGMQLIGPAWEEHRLLSVAQAFQEETDWHLQAPPNTSVPFQG
jgi:aspartyl-tRNA(Asn)/glutamyl-tRNA(Gln) amidotransferase subunit A